jgi:hypothetical protein
MRKGFGVLSIICVCICTLTILACIKKRYEGPPDTSGYDPHLAVTHTIAQLLTMPVGLTIAEDIIISGVVIMDDKSGNYYKKIVIQDSTGGVEIELDQNSLYNDYPVGRKVYIKCKGLYLAKNNGNPQLGGTLDITGNLSPIPSVLINNYVIKANYPNPVVPDTFTINELKSADVSHLNTLVAIKNIEFVDSNVGIPYAAMASLSSATSLYLKDCNGGTIVLRNSGYALFQPYLTPSGNGVLTGILTKYKNDIQLIIRDTTDVRFENVRCEDSGPKEETLFMQDFSGLTDNMEVALPGWTNFAETGGKKFTKSSFQSDVFAKISAYGGSVPAVVKTWLITPPVNLAGKSNAKLIFKTKDGYNNGATLKVYVSANYSGSGDPSTATWTDLAAVVSSGNSNGYASQWAIANIALNYSVPVFIAFKYEGGGSKTTTYELGYITVTAN